MTVTCNGWRTRGACYRIRRKILQEVFVILFLPCASQAARCTARPCAHKCTAAADTTPAESLEATPSHHRSSHGFCDEQTRARENPKHFHRLISAFNWTALLHILPAWGKQVSAVCRDPSNKPHAWSPCFHEAKLGYILVGCSFPGCRNATMKIKSQHISPHKHNLSNKWWIFAEFITAEDCKAGFRNCFGGFWLGSSFIHIT